MRVREATAAEGPAWDAFVASRPDATFCHRFGWSDAIARTFGHPTLYRVAEQDGAIVGVLPLAQVRTRLFGNTLISVPFCVYGGPLAATPEARAALDAEAAALRAKHAATACEYRFRDTPHDADDWVGRPALYATFRRAIGANDDANLKAIPRKQRAVVRKALDCGDLTATPSRDAATLFPLYAESVRNLGTPVFPRRWFDTLLAVFGDDAEVMTVREGDTPVAACLSFYFRDEVLPYYAGGNAGARRGGYDFLYWAIMRRAAARGAKTFDFGRSKEGTGPYAFKKNWGFDPAPLHYRFNLAPGAAIPENNPNNPKYRAMIAAWKRLPLPVANLLGPRIVRGVG